MIHHLQTSEIDRQILGRNILLLLELVVVAEEPLLLGAPGRGGVKMR